MGEARGDSDTGTLCIVKKHQKYPASCDMLVVKREQLMTYKLKILIVKLSTGQPQLWPGASPQLNLSVGNVIN